MTRSFVTRHHSSLPFSFILLLPFLFHSSSPCDLLFLQINLSSVQRVASISLRATVFTLTTGRKRDECLWRGGCKDFPRDLLTLSESVDLVPGLNGRWGRIPSNSIRKLGRLGKIESMGKEEKRRPRAWRRGTSLSPSESITRPFYFCARPESRPGLIKLFVSIVPTFPSFFHPNSALPSFISSSTGVELLAAGYEISDSRDSRPFLFFFPLFF